MHRLLLVLSLLFLLSCNKDGGSPTPGTGIGGSTARFTVSDNTLYIVGATSLQAFDITNSSNPIPGAKTTVGMGVETIFPYRDKLFVGTQTGMFIYDITQPARPKQVSVYTHIQSCDPVVAQGNYAYVTLRSGTNCRNRTNNSLDVVDFSDLNNLKQIGSYPMKNPHGLGVDGKLLFVGEGEYGLRILDVSNPAVVLPIQYIDSVKAYDVIPYQNRLIVTSPAGISQYSYATNQLTHLSTLPVQP
ncbi:LVIVD repeat-containing protein [Spirosoma oryzae]|uniref:LVIVD repeat-containing protein n=1 Tax=Spirosoma oryzae TaxID=1469603 RepID=A0A2T0TF89_9BACT|nr:LVIVD repeat-containing protein [Spirosoma oryzae]